MDLLNKESYWAVTKIETGSMNNQFQDQPDKDKHIVVIHKNTDLDMFKKGFGAVYYSTEYLLKRIFANKKTVARITVITFCMALGTSASLQAKAVPPVKDFAEQVNRGDEDINLDEIEKKLWDNIYKRPYSYGHYAKLALFYDFVGDYKNELEALKIHVSYLPEDFEEKYISYGNLARAFLLNGNWEEGKQWLDRADEINPHNVSNRWNAFRYYSQYEHNFVEAAKQLAILDHMGDPADDIFYDGFIYVIAFDGVTLQQAVELFQEAVRQNPDHPKAIRALAETMRLQATRDRSISMAPVYELLERVIELDANFIPAYITLAIAYLVDNAGSRREYGGNEALKLAARARKIDPDHKRLDFIEGTAYLWLEDYMKAITLLQGLMDQGIDDKQVRESLAAAYNDMAYDMYVSGERLEEGLELVDKAIVLKPEDGGILSTKAELLYKLERYEEAWQYITRSIVLEPDHEEIQKDYQMIQEALGRQ